ncbi:MAG: hypothetical protein ORN57_01460, partial [Alphaproteobacteria bacterium]|nr:hypothetical protein [Alphaproteobacteria bacterium]
HGLAMACPWLVHDALGHDAKDKKVGIMPSALVDGASMIGKVCPNRLHDTPIDGVDEVINMAHTYLCGADDGYALSIRCALSMTHLAMTHSAMTQKIKKSGLCHLPWLMAPA